MNNDTTLDLVLEGRILLVEKDKDGNIIKEDELNGKDCLQCLLVCIEEGLPLIVEKLVSKKQQNTWNPEED